MKINWDVIPSYNIEVKKLSQPYDISLLFRKAKIKFYVYRIMVKGIVIKYGMSAANPVRNVYGERLYRQIGHCKSWNNQRLVCASGSDWRIIEEDFFNTYGYEIDKNDISITVWDLTKYPFQTINLWDEVYAAEQELIQKYTTVVGQKPIGNINDDKNIIYKSYIKQTTWKEMFEC